MAKNEEFIKKQGLFEVIGKYFVLNKSQDSYIQGWLTIDKTLKAFIKNLKEEIEYELDLENIFIENYILYSIDINNGSLIEIKDDKKLNNIRRNDKILIVLLDKRINLNKIEDIPILQKWYLDSVANYEI